MRLVFAVLVTTLYVGVSGASFLRHFSGREARVPLFSALDDALGPLRVVNTYHLFAHITRERIEPEFQTFDGSAWTAHALHYKPGPLDRAPPFVAPHQPRVDFQLWFYGLRHSGRPPLYVHNLLDRLCHAPRVVQPLFTRPLPEEPEAVRVVFQQYHFTQWADRSSDFWTRGAASESRVLRCR